MTPGPGTWGDTPTDVLNLGHELPPPSATPPTEDEEVSPDVATFVTVANRAARGSGWTVTWRDLESAEDQESPALVPFPLDDDQSGRPAWAYLDREAARRRHVVIAQFAFAGRHAYAVDTERRDGEDVAVLVLADQYGARLSEEALRRLLRTAVERVCAGKSPWPTTWPYVSGLYQRVSHGHPPSDATPAARDAYVHRFAARLGRQVRDAFGIR